MHGRILWQFRDYVEARHGGAAWATLLKAAGLENRVYLAQPYPDTEVVSLLRAAEKMTGKPIPVLLQDFGEFTVPALLSMYSYLIKPEWRTLDVIEHAEKAAHGAVRQQVIGAAPPYLRVRRVDSNRVILAYNSPRKMCALAMGVGIGLGKHFQEDILVQHYPPVCLGVPCCEITYTSRPKNTRVL